MSLDYVEQVYYDLLEEVCPYCNEKLNGESSIQASNGKHYHRECFHKAKCTDFSISDLLLQMNHILTEDFSTREEIISRNLPKEETND